MSKRKKSGLALRPAFNVLTHKTPGKRKKIVLPEPEMFSRALLGGEYTREKMTGGGRKHTWEGVVPIGVNVYHRKINEGAKRKRRRGGRAPSGSGRVTSQAGHIGRDCKELAS